MRVKGNGSVLIYIKEMMWRQCTETGFDTCQADPRQRARDLGGRGSTLGFLTEGSLRKDPAAEVKQANVLLLCIYRKLAYSPL